MTRARDIAHEIARRLGRIADDLLLIVVLLAVLAFVAIADAQRRLSSDE